MGFQPSKQERLELSGLIFQSIMTLLLKLNKLGFQPWKNERHEVSGLIRQSMIHS